MLQDCPFSVKVDQDCRKSQESQERLVREGYAVEDLKLYKHRKLEDVPGKLLQGIRSVSQRKRELYRKVCFLL